MADGYICSLRFVRNFSSCCFSWDTFVKKCENVNCCEVNMMGYPTMETVMVAQ